MKTMRVVRAERFGGPEVLRAVEVPIPEPGPGQVRIRVQAAAVNFADVMRRRASPYPFPTALPYVPGSEVAGVIDALGEGVAGPPVGTPVLALVGEGGEGGYAERAIANAARVIPIPPGLTPEAAASLLVAGTTAVLLLTWQRSPSTKDRRVLSRFSNRRAIEPQPTISRRGRCVRACWNGSAVSRRPPTPTFARWR